MAQKEEGMKLQLIAFGALLLLVGCGKPESPSSPALTTEVPRAPVVAEKAPEPVKPPIKKGPWEGPFGVKMGISLDDLRGAVELKDGDSKFTFESKQAPSPHDAFEVYLYTLTEETGLCKVAALGKPVTTSRAGFELRSEFASLQTALTERYGKPSTKYDFLSRGSIWNESQDWMMGLLKKDRILTTFWIASPEDKSTPKADLPNNLETIVLEANAESSETGRIAIRYAFKNETACVDLIKKSRHKAL